MVLIKNTVAVICGFLAVAILSTLTDAALEAVGIFPSISYQMKYGMSASLLALALLYRTLFAILGGYLTARVSSTKPMRNVLILAIIGTILGTLGTIANWSKTTPGTEWYPILLIPLSFFGVWFGGNLKKDKK